MSESEESLDGEALLDLVTRKLLHKFGRGKHKPGSGSAAAFSGLLAANLIRTVITITIKKKDKPHYGVWSKHLNEFLIDIDEKILPVLEEYFEKDSIEFDKVHDLRKRRNREKNLVKKGQLEIQHLEQLRIATEIPIQIAKECIKIAEVSDFVFKNGFQSARGDSFVALSSSVGAVSGCLSIIELNLLSFLKDEWTDRISDEIFHLRSHYSNLLESTIKCADVLKLEVQMKMQCNQEVQAIIEPIKGKPKLSNREIEGVAKKLQRLVWKNKDWIWQFNVPSDPLEILKPDLILRKVIGYQCYRSRILYAEDGSIESNEVAGIIDQKKRIVYISSNHPEETQNFAIAHELGHAIFHKQEFLHRDRPLDGSDDRSSRDLIEYQADKFATYFLMPAKAIIEVFRGIYEVEVFEVDHDNSFNLMQIGPNELRKRLKNIRGLARMLASTNRFGPKNFYPLNVVFGVSTEAMAIRLEELNLLKF